MEIHGSASVLPVSAGRWLRCGAAPILAALVACSGPPTTLADLGGSRDGGSRDGGDAGGDAAPAPPFQVRESVEQLHVTHASPGTTLILEDRSGVELQRGTVGDLGSLMFRKVSPGEGYVVRAASEPAAEVGPLRVLSIPDSLPSQSFYQRQQLNPGFGYLSTRDGTTLSVYVTLPGPAEDGPYPTVVSYSGYAPSRPGEPVGDFGALCKELPALCDAPNDPGALIAALLGYATASVNIRGTGCSGGACDFFEPLQLLDGYDVIETVAAQPWVLGHRVGMVGLSYPGITQLFVASVRPPSLAAITPLSVIGNTATTLLPGGMLNDGFALSWVINVLDKAEPYGQGWEQAQVDAGDTVCAENQLLHGQKVDNVEQARNTPYYDPEVTDPLNPTLFVDRIDVPVFIAGAYQDEQTGPFFSALLDRFTASPLLRATVYNGVHVDAFAPQIVGEWSAFLDFHVARKIPAVKPVVRQLAGLLFARIFGATLAIPDDRFGSYGSYDEAYAAYRAEPALRVIFESGGGADPGAPVGTFERSFSGWPPVETQALRFYFHTDGSLRAAAPDGSDDGASQFTLDPGAGERGILGPGASVDDKLPAYDWRAPPAGQVASWLTEPLAADLVLLGTGSVDLYLRSNVDDADLEGNLSEIRPDGQEMYVQSGWLRASQRKLADGSTELRPDPTQLEADVAPLPAGEWTLVRVQLAAFGHVFRCGSRIRLAVDTPGDSRADWRFRLETFPVAAVHQVAHSAAYPSSVALPLLEGVTAPTPLPACPSLRGQPCRAYTPVPNTPAP